MAQFIQPTQLAPVQAGIGSQAMVQDSTPSVEGLTNNLLNTADMAADMYSESKAKSLVKETVEEIDAARAVAEKSQFTSGDPVPEELKVDQQQWDMLAGAVQSGQMSRENARLIASSRLRSRIAEQPLFANRMRKAASGVLGFNIESEGAQQYFSSFATNAQISKQNESGIDKKRRELMNTAARYKEVGLFSTQEEGYAMLVKADGASVMKQRASDELEMGAITSMEFATKFNTANQVSAWGTTLGEIKAFELSEGKPIDGVAFSRILEERKQSAVAEFNAGWAKSGPTGTPEYNRALGNLTTQYDDMKDFADTYGVDNLTSVAIERAVQAREVYGDEFFPTMKLITQNFGQQVSSDILKLSALVPSQREAMFRGNPQLKSAYELLGQDPAKFNKSMADTGTAVINGGDLSQQDPVLLDAAATQLYDTGTQDTQKAVVEGLFAGALNWKGTSLAVSKSPRVSHPEVIKTVQKQYDTAITPVIKQFTQQITNNPYLTWELNDAGMLSVKEREASPDINRQQFGGLVTDPAEAQNRILQAKRAKQTADKLNQFAKAHGNGWSSVVGESFEQYKQRVNTLVTESVIDDGNVKRTAVNNSVTQVVGLIEDSDLRSAKARYNELRDQYPFDITDTWEDILESLQGE